MRRELVVASLFVVFAAAGCSPLSSEMLKALASDESSVCFSSDIRGGAGMVAGMPTGGYGQTTNTLCRSKMPNAKMEVKPDGSISIQHGEVQP